MMEHPAYWEAAGHVATLIEAFIMAYCFYCFAAPFTQNKKSARYSSIVYFLAMSGMFFFMARLDVYVIYAIMAMAAFITLYLMERENLEQKAFLVVTFFALEWLTRAMSEILYDHLYAFAADTAFMARHLRLWFALYVGVLLYYLLLRLLFTMTAIRCIVKAYVYKYAHMGKKELLMLALPSFVAVVGYEIMRYYRAFYIVKTESVSDAYDALFFFYCAIFVVMIVVIIILYQSIKTTQEEKLQNELLTAKVDSIRQHIGQVEGLYHDIRSLKHDMGNHIMTLERLYEEKETTEAKAYSAQLKAALAEMTGEIRSGNPVTDVILQEMKGKAEKKGIYFHHAFFYPEDSDINAFDISVILHNALQNAIENAEGEGAYISVLSYRKRNAYMIEIKNSFAGTLQWHPESGLPMTSKEKKPGNKKQSGYLQAHGYGLSNIRRVARKYAGDIDITVKDGAFCLSVMLMV